MTESYHTIRTVRDGNVVTLWLARPEVHNAFNKFMINEITSFFTSVEKRDEIRMVVIRGEGKSFCSGADLQWMKSSFSLSEEENLKESQALATMLSTIYSSTKVVIAAVHGHIYGGGMGLVAVSDLAYGTANSLFALSEAKLGITAATITPYLLMKVRPSVLKELIFTAKTFQGNEAVHYGLMNEIFPTMEFLDEHLARITAGISQNGRLALISTKQLINQLTFLVKEEEFNKLPELLAQIRISPEAQEGFSAFLEKRKPNW